MTLCSEGHRFVKTNRNTRCPICQPERNRQRYRADPYRRLLSSSQWQATRKRVMARDGGRCRLEGVGEGCGGRIEAHHLLGVRQGGSPFDPANVVLLCRLHHEDVEHGRIVFDPDNPSF